MAINEKLIIELQTSLFALISQDDAVEVCTIPPHAESLSVMAEGKEVILLVPAFDVSLMQVHLPKMNRTRLLQALPFALEDQLVSEIDTLHFVPQRTEINDSIAVALVSHQKMQQWLSELEQLKIKPDQLISSVFALPFKDKSWHVALYNDIAMFRMGPFEGFASDLQNAMFYLTTILERTPQEIEIDNYTDIDFHEAVNDIKVRFPLVTITISKRNSENRITDFAYLSVKGPSINLLQGKYIVKKPKRVSINKALKLTASLALVWLGLMVFSPIVSYFILESRATYLDGEIKKIYGQYFKSGTVIAPKMRMEDKLRHMADTVNKNKFLLLLAEVSEATITNQNIKIKRIDFQDNILRLELMALTSDDLTTFTDALTKSGLAVTQQGADLAGTHINAALIINGSH